MMAYIIRKAIKSKLFQTICVSTEDAEVMKIAEKYGAEVPFVRPDVLSRDPSTIVDVMLHALESYSNDGIVFERITVLLPTAPFVTVADIQKAHEIYNKSDADALLSVTSTEFPPYNAWLIEDTGGQNKLTPCFPESPYKHTKSTECPTTYRSNGAILIVDTKKLYENKGYQGLKIIPYVMPAEHSLDVDTNHEYMLAKCFMESSFFEEQQELFL